MTVRRPLTALLLSGAALVATAAPAWAHTELESSNPAKGASLATAPTKIELTFGEAVSLPAAPISVTGPDGATWAVGTGSVAGAVVTAPVTPSGPAGQYTIKYKVTSDDGDAVTGTIPFTLTAPASTATPSTPPSAPASTQAATQPAPAAAQASDASHNGGLPAWEWVLIGAVVLILAGLGVFLARRRNRTPGDS